MTADSSIETCWSLVQRLKNGDDQDSWRTFCKTYSRLIHSVAVKSGLTETEAEDVVQETTLSVVKQMPTFKVDPQFGSFEAWLLNIARRRVVDQFRRRGRLSTLIRREPALDSIANLPDNKPNDLEQIWEAEWQQTIAENVLLSVRKLVSARQYQIYDLHVLKDWTIEKVIAFLNVSPNQVYIAKSRVNAVMVRETARLQKHLL